MPKQQKQKLTKHRVRFDRNTRTEVMSDSRTQRQRERGQAERAALQRELEELADEVDSALEDL